MKHTEMGEMRREIKKERKAKEGRKEEGKKRMFYRKGNRHIGRKKIDKSKDKGGTKCFRAGTYILKLAGSAWNLSNAWPNRADVPWISVTTTRYVLIYKAKVTRKEVQREGPFLTFSVEWSLVARLKAHGRVLLLANISRERSHVGGHAIVRVEPLRRGVNL